jgi:hypothetical protein
VDESVQASSFKGGVHCGQDVFRLGRDDHMNLRITHGRVEYWNPGSDERHHYMYLSHQKDDCISHQENDDYLVRNTTYFLLLCFAIQCCYFITVNCNFYICHYCSVMTMEGPSLIWMGRSWEWLTTTLTSVLYLLVSWRNV